MRKWLKQAKNKVIKLLGGHTEGDMAHIYRRTKMLSIHKTLSRGHLYYASSQAEQRIEHFYSDPNGDTQRWLPILAEKQ